MGLFLNRGLEEFKAVVNSKIYVDKTDMISFLNEVINTEQRYLCVSRPRRFGKSITANMIAAYYEKGIDASSLFKERKLGQLPAWDKNLNQYDVIRIDLADILATQGNAEATLDYIENQIIQELNTSYSEVIHGTSRKLADRLAEINDQTGSQFIIIIDEWDCLFREDKNNISVQERYINLLRSLFKGNRSKKFMALAYITGILSIKRYNSESALNNFYEYTMTNPQNLSKYVGFTVDEVKELCETYQMNLDEVLDWYDGYSFENCKHICGPNSVVRAMFSGKCENYWSKTVAFSSLTSYITMNFDGLKDAIIQALSGQQIKVCIDTFENDLTNFKRKDDVLTVLIHLGYLAYDPEKELAYIPNKEVRQCFERVIEDTGWSDVIETLNQSESLLIATLHEDAEEVAERIDRCHAANTSILKYNDENALASVLSLAYYTARKDYMIIREMPGGYGFADLVFLPKHHVDKPAMIVELKWKKNAETAISQIKLRKYIQALDGFHGDVLLVGINYEKKSKEKLHSCIIEKIFV